MCAFMFMTIELIINYASNCKKNISQHDNCNLNILILHYLLSFILFAVLPVAEKKPSCILTNVVSTCVNKASAHLELLQTLIEEWFAQLPKAGCEEHSYNVAKGIFVLIKI